MVSEDPMCSLRGHGDQSVPEHDGVLLNSRHGNMQFLVILAANITANMSSDGDTNVAELCKRFCPGSGTLPRGCLTFRSACLEDT